LRIGYSPLLQQSLLAGNKPLKESKGRFKISIDSLYLNEPSSTAGGAPTITKRYSQIMPFCPDRTVAKVGQIIENSDSRLCLLNIHCGELPKKQKNELYQLLQRFQTRFCFTLSDIGQTKSAEMKIELTTDKPIVYAPYRLSAAERETVKNMITKFLDAGIIRKSHSY
jgi:hypothetical protein